MRIAVDGRSVFIGTGSGHPAADASTVVFIHGAAHDHTIWVMPARYFARHGMRVLAPDLPGHGRTDGPALTSVDALADWMDACSKRPYSNAAIVGHSMGGLVAMSLAIRHPTRVRSLALLGVSVPMPVTERLLTAARTTNRRRRYGEWLEPQRARPTRRQPESGLLDSRWRCTADRPRRSRRASRRPGCVQRVSMRSLCYPRTDARDRRRIGPDDAGAQRASGCCCDRGSRVVSLAGCGHAMLFEQPNQVLDALIDSVAVTV